jgi:hypothetical protein
MVEAADGEGWFDWAYYIVVASVVLVVPVALYAIYPRLKLPRPNCCYHLKCKPIGKRILLLLMCLTFGIELGFQLATRQMIWFEIPFHLATMLQVGQFYYILLSFFTNCNFT